MISEANIPNLLRLIRNNEAADGFDLSGWFHACGTFGCLVGNDLLACGQRKAIQSCATYLDVGQIYGLGSWVSQFLFSNRSGRKNGFGFVFDDVDNAYMLAGQYRDELDRDAAIRRVRKMVYYVLHKRELLYDDSGRIRETARRSEGNHMVLRSVKSAVERKERELTAV